MRSSSRRLFLHLLASTAMMALLGRRAFSDPLDQGIGGTGAMANSTEETDRGIGGTGVIGTIRKFGSIIVNDMRIAYAADADVRIDGQRASARDLKIGQVVHVDATGPAGSLSTDAIDVNSEVVGPVEHAGAKQIVVLGQAVSTATLKKRAYTVGDTVAVSGLRRNDGTIVASLIERRSGAPTRVTGPVRVADNGSLRIGGLTLRGIDGSLVDRRVFVEGRLEGPTFVVTHAVSEAARLPPTLRTLSIESYIERRDGSLTLGSGFLVSNANGFDLPTGQSVRAVLNTSLGPNGSLILESVRANGKTYGAAAQDGSGRGGLGGGGYGGARGPGGGNGPGGGTSGTHPMNFGAPSSGSPGSGGPNSGGPGSGGPGGGFGGGGSGSGFSGPSPGGGFGGGRR